MQTTVHTKLIALRDKRKRWTTRLNRASNMLSKLAKQEARLIKAGQAKHVEKPTGQKPAITETTDLPELDAYFQPAIQQIAAKDVPAEIKKISVRPRGSALIADLPGTLADAARESAEDAGLLDIPKELKRPPFISPNPDQGAAILAKKAKVDKTAMPLSGKEAKAAIMAQSAKITEKRAKRNRPFEKK